MPASTDRHCGCAPFVGESRFEAIIRLVFGEVVRQDDHRPDHPQRNRNADATAQADAR